MSYKVVRRFQDLQDNRYTYNTGDTFPREGFEVSADRIEQLSTTNNLKGKIFIEKVAEEDTTATTEAKVEEAPQTEQPKEGLSEPQEDTSTKKTGSHPSKKSEAKGKSKKTQE